MELPRLKTLWEKYRGQGFEVIAINQPYVEKEKYLTYIAENGFEFTFLLDSREGAVDSGLYGGGGHPTSYLIGKDGRTYYHHLGFEEGDEVFIEMEILELLGQ